jgi:hypothetical protein
MAPEGECGAIVEQPGDFRGLAALRPGTVTARCDTYFTIHIAFVWCVVCARTGHCRDLALP